MENTEEIESTNRGENTNSDTAPEQDTILGSVNSILQQVSEFNESIQSKDNIEVDSLTKLEDMIFKEISMSPSPQEEEVDMIDDDILLSENIDDNLRKAVEGKSPNPFSNSNNTSHENFLQELKAVFGTPPHEVNVVEVNALAGRLQSSGNEDLHKIGTSLRRIYPLKEVHSGYGLNLWKRALRYERDMCDFLGDLLVRLFYGISTEELSRMDTRDVPGYSPLHRYRINGYILANYRKYLLNKEPFPNPPKGWMSTLKIPTPEPVSTENPGSDRRGSSLTSAATRPPHTDNLRSNAGMSSTMGYDPTTLSFSTVDTFQSCNNLENSRNTFSEIVRRVRNDNKCLCSTETAMNNVVLLAERIRSLQNYHTEITSEYTRQYTALTEKLATARLEVKKLTDEAVQMKDSYERDSLSVQNQINEAKRKMEVPTTHPSSSYRPRGSAPYPNRGYSSNGNYRRNWNQPGPATCHHDDFTGMHVTRRFQVASDQPHGVPLVTSQGSSNLQVELPPVEPQPSSSSSVNEAVSQVETSPSTESVKETSYEAQLRKTSELFYVGILTGAHTTNLAGSSAVREATLKLLAEDFKVRKEKLATAISPKDQGTSDKSVNLLHAAQWDGSVLYNDLPQVYPQFMGKKWGEESAWFDTSLLNLGELKSDLVAKLLTTVEKSLNREITTLEQLKGILTELALCVEELTITLTGELLRHDTQVFEKLDHLPVDKRNLWLITIIKRRTSEFLRHVSNLLGNLNVLYGARPLAEYSKALNCELQPMLNKLWWIANVTTPVSSRIKFQ